MHQVKPIGLFIAIAGSFSNKSKHYKTNGPDPKIAPLKNRLYDEQGRKQGFGPPTNRITLTAHQLKGFRCENPSSEAKACRLKGKFALLRQVSHSEAVVSGWEPKPPRRELNGPRPDRRAF